MESFKIEHIWETYPIKNCPSFYYYGEGSYGKGRDMFKDPSGLKYVVDIQYGDFNTIEDLLKEFGITIRLYPNLVFLITEDEYNYLNILLPPYDGKRYLSDQRTIQLREIKWV